MTPEKFLSWRNGGLKIRKLDPLVAYPNRDGVCLINWHDEIADYRIRHEGVKSELLAYVEGIGARSS